MTSSVSQAKEHILCIYEQKQKIASADLANSINLIVNDVLEGGLPFEFIQNADDATPNGQEGSITFDLQENTLTITHDGRRFSYEDVEKICAIAQQKYLDKIENEEMIGQKGVGIKAAFSAANRMVVYSHPYCFRFEEEYTVWKGRPRSNLYPWQITPIWTEFPANLDSNKVHFILDLRDPEKIREQLEDLKSMPRVLMFLNRIRKITVLGTQLSMKVGTKTKRGIRGLYCDNELESEWIYKAVHIDIPSNVRKELQAMNAQDCPDKFKTTTYKLRLFFAFRFGNSGLMKATNTVLSCYLPTKVQCGFPFLVNADFLLEASRKNLKKNNWNAWVLGQVARQHFDYLAEMAKVVFLRKGILNVLAPPSLTGLDKELIQVYTSKYKEYKKTVGFIPSQQDPEQLLCLTNCRLDTTQFFRVFQDKLHNKKSNSDLVDDELDNLNVLKRIHQVPTLTYADIIEYSQTFLKKQPELMGTFLEFFKDSWEEVGDFQEEFVSSCSLPNGFGTLSLIRDFFLTDSEFDYPECLKIPVFSAAYAPLKKWLQKEIGTKILSKKEIILGPLVSFVVEGKVNRRNTISILRFLYTALHEEEIRISELPNLGSVMEILTKNNSMRLANKCYLSNFYGPSFSLEDIVNDPDLFVSTKYFNQGDNLATWKKLFIALKVPNELSVIHPPAQKISFLESRNVSHLKDYLDYLYDNPGSPLQKRVPNGEHLLLNFVYVPFMEFLHLKGYSDHFWKIILNNWDTVYSSCIDPKYKSSNRETQLKISYLQHYIQTMPLCSIQQQPISGKELYAPYLKELVGDWLAVADIPYSMSPYQAEFFGFKTKIDPMDCLEVFKKMRLSGKPLSISKYTRLLEAFVEGYPQLRAQQKSKIKKCEKFVLAEDGSWQRCGPALTCSLIPGAIQRFDRKDRVKIVLPLDSMGQLAEIMGFKTITQVKVIEMLPNAEEDKIFSLDLRKKLALIALLEGSNQAEEAEAILRNLVKQARSLKIFQVPRISLSSDSHDITDVFLNETTLYYQGRCPSKKVKLGQKLGEYFNLSLPTIQLLPEILSLKEATGKDCRGIPDFLSERGLSSKLLHNLKRMYNPAKLSLLDEEELEEDVQSSSSSGKEDVDALPYTDAPEHTSESSEWSPEVTIEDYSMSDGDIPKLDEENSGEEESTLSDLDEGGKRKTKGHHKKKEVNFRGKQDISDKSKDKIGYWGEKFAVKKLIHVYEKKYDCKANEISCGYYKFVAEGVLKLSLKWMNAEGESCNPYDIKLSKPSRERRKLSRERLIEVKATKNDQIRFFLSENEWEIMQSTPKYRLYIILKAGSKEAKMHRISHLKEWVNSKDTQIREHKKYEVTSNVQLKDKT